MKLEKAQFLDQGLHKLYWTIKLRTLIEYDDFINIYSCRPACYYNIYRRGTECGLLYEVPVTLKHSVRRRPLFHSRAGYVRVATRPEMEKTE
jgi:hypothetical protein